MSSCATSPSAITAEALARIASTASEPSSTMSWKARENRKSPTSTLGLLPQIGVGGGETAAQAALVDHVVVEQGGGVDELDRRGQLEMAIAVVGAELGGDQGQHRPDPLAAGGDQVTGELRDQPDRAVEALDDQLVDPGHVGVDQGLDGLQPRVPGPLTQLRTHGGQARSPRNGYHTPLAIRAGDAMQTWRLWPSPI